MTEPRCVWPGLCPRPATETVEAGDVTLQACPPHADRLRRGDGFSYADAGDVAAAKRLGDAAEVAD